MCYTDTYQMRRVALFPGRLKGELGATITLPSFMGTQPRSQREAQLSSNTTAAKNKVTESIPLLEYW